MGKHVHFELPNTKACREIITDILKHQSLDASQVDVHIVTGKIVGRSHAQISELLGDVAKRKFVKKGQKVEITTDDILLAIGEKLG
jgi:SpoVK/Ycf46/Vps4 family AAA+-type ATPase